MSRPNASLIMMSVAALWLTAATPLVSAQVQWGSAKQGVRAGATPLSVRETAVDVVISLEGDVLFDFDRFDLRGEAEPLLQKAIEVVRRYPGRRITLAGHTDAKGARPYNLTLSEQRAEAVKAWLVTHGVAAEQITTRGYGQSRPVAPNANPDGSDNPTGRQKNRRVEIIVNKN